MCPAAATHVSTNYVPRWAKSLIRLIFLCQLGVGTLGATLSIGFSSRFVAVVDINEEGARSVSTKIGNAASPIRCDVAVGPDVRNAVETTRKIFGRLDIVVEQCWNDTPQ